jgi:4-amino-4-deoxy-L-arabinose transferase-like glycosyltransferase
MKESLHKLLDNINNLPDSWLIPIIFLLALALRLGVAFILPEDYPLDSMSDRFQYESIATNILNNQVYGLQSGVSDQYIPPGYPGFVALVYLLLGQSIWSLRIAQCLIGSATIIPVYYLARWIYPNQRWIAKLSILTLAIHPVLILYSSFQLTETFYLFLSQLFILALCLSLDNLRPSHGLITGLLFGATLLVREVLVIYIAFVILIAFLRRPSWQKFTKYTLALLLGIGLVITPWLIRNYRNTNRVIFITDRAAYAASKITGSTQLPSGYENLNEDVRQRSEFDAARYATLNQMLDPQFFIADPNYYFRIVWIRFELTWLHPNGLESIPNEILQGVYRALNASILLFAFIGIWEAVKARRWRLLPITGLWVYAILIHLFLSTAAPRYAIPLIPSIHILAIAGLLWSLIWGKSRIRVVA